MIGSFYGMTKALMDKNIKTLPNKSIQRVQILNHITKTGGGLAQRFGSLGLIYAISDAAIQYSGVSDDNVTTVAATTTTGLIYGSASKACIRIAVVMHLSLCNVDSDDGIFSDLSQGWRRPAAGGAVGFLIGMSIVGISNLDQFKMFMGRILNY